MYNGVGFGEELLDTQRALHEVARRAARDAVVGAVDAVAVDAVHSPKPGAVKVAAVCTGAADDGGTALV